jgi:hypothetical protein
MSSDPLVYDGNAAEVRHNERENVSHRHASASQAEVLNILLQGGTFSTCSKQQMDIRAQCTIQRTRPE